MRGAGSESMAWSAADRQTGAGRSQGFGMASRSSWILQSSRTVLQGNDSAGLEQLPQCIDQNCLLALLIWDWRLCTPYRLGPRDIRVPARDNVHVQLRHLVAQRGDVELVASRDGLERIRGRRDLAKQLHLRVILEIDEFDQSGQSRHQDQPWVVRVVCQKDAREGEVADGNCVLRELGMQRPILCNT